MRMKFHLTQPSAISPDTSATTEFVLASHTDERKKDSSATAGHLLRNSDQVPGTLLLPRMGQVPIVVRPGDR